MWEAGDPTDPVSPAYAVRYSGVSIAGTSRARPLRVVTQCDSVDEFVAVFGHFYDGESLFVVTPSVRPEGSVQTVALALRCGVAVVLRGEAEVVRSLSQERSPYGKAGMRLRFRSTEGNGARVLVRLAQEAAALAAMPTVPMDALDGDASPMDIGERMRRLLNENVARRVQSLVTQRIGAIQVRPMRPATDDGGETAPPDEAARDDAERRLAELLECHVLEEEPDAASVAGAPGAQDDRAIAEAQAPRRSARRPRSAWLWLLAVVVACSAAGALFGQWLGALGETEPPRSTASSVSTSR
jgi:hypothetical protein